MLYFCFLKNPNIGTDKPDTINLTEVLSRCLCECIGSKSFWGPEKLSAKNVCKNLGLPGNGLLLTYMDKGADSKFFEINEVVVQRCSSSTEAVVVLKLEERELIWENCYSEDCQNQIPFYFTFFHFVKKEGKWRYAAEDQESISPPFSPIPEMSAFFYP